MLIDGFGISNYRSFGPDVQLIGPLSKINLLIGANNSGKSNVLRFLAEHYPRVTEAAWRKRSYDHMHDIDRHIGRRHQTSTLFAIGMRSEGQTFEEWLETRFARYSQRPDYGVLVQWIRRIVAFLAADTEVAWFYYDGAWSKLALAETMIDQVTSALSHGEWVRLWNILTSKEGGHLKTHWVRESLYELSPVHRPAPNVTPIPAFRKVDASAIKENDYSGLGLVDRLARLQNPDQSDQRIGKAQFEKINNFLRVVTGNETATLEIPYARDTILVHMDSKSLPLSSLGTGIHEVIILAAAATVVTGQVLCVEEPEIHLHPTLQRKLLAYLRDSTDNQYLIATHSAHLLDMPDARVFRVRYEDGETKVSPAGAARERAEICADLGYRPSDLLQANSVIWVEGPSDRIYLNHWIRALASDLVEGVHYSVMFYGGRLLCHLSANDPEVDEFISLRRLNRHIAILIDSDKRSAASGINETKKRVQEEFDQGPGFAWITEGREIENYIEKELLESAISAICRRARRFPQQKDRFRDALSYIDDTGKRRDDVDKIKLAREVAKLDPNLEVLDLREKATKLVSFIRAANGLDS